MKRWLIAGNLIAIGLVVFYGAFEYVRPFAATYLWRENYKSLMFNCDQVMRDHFIAKRAVSLEPNQTTVKNLKAAELGLIDCHDYDKLRKRMLVWGVTELNLSAIGLEAMESKAYELRQFVEIHEIRY
jgi:hypothetical protein